MKKTKGAFPQENTIYKEYLAPTGNDEFKYRMSYFNHKPSTMYVISAYIDGFRFKVVKSYYIIIKNDGNVIQLARFKTLWQMNMKLF